MAFELIHKPTFTNQLLVVPKERITQILAKVEVLRTDPSPHEPLKRKLHGYRRDMYRLRSGDSDVLNIHSMIYVRRWLDNIAQR